MRRRPLQLHHEWAGSGAVHVQWHVQSAVGDQQRCWCADLQGQAQRSVVHGLGGWQGRPGDRHRRRGPALGGSRELTGTARRTTSTSAPMARLDVVVDRVIQIILSTEVQQRTMLRLSLDPDPEVRAELPLRKGGSSRGSSRHWSRCTPNSGRTECATSPWPSAVRSASSPRVAGRCRWADARRSRRHDALVRPFDARVRSCRGRPRPVTGGSLRKRRCARATSRLSVEAHRLEVVHEVISHWTREVTAR